MVKTLSSGVIFALTGACRDAVIARVDMQNQHLVHANNMFAYPVRKIVAEHPLRCAPIKLAKLCCAFTKAEKHFVILSMTGT